MTSEDREPTEDELQRAYEEQVKRIRVEQVLLENVVSIVNLAMRRTGIAPGTEDERDPDQVRLGIESIRALLPVIDQIAPEESGAIRDALSQLQFAFVRIGGQPSAGAEDAQGQGGQAGAGQGGQAGGAAGPDGGTGSAEPEPEPVKPGEPGPAQRSGRLWVPGQ